MISILSQKDIKYKFYHITVRFSYQLQKNFIQLKLKFSTVSNFFYFIMLAKTKTDFIKQLESLG